jgi:hypothetical protein
MLWTVNSLFAQAAAPEASSVPWFLINLLVALATIGVSFFLGGYLGKKLRMTRNHNVHVITPHGKIVAGRKGRKG